MVRPFRRKPPNSVSFLSYDYDGQANLIQKRITEENGIKAYYPFNGHGDVSIRNTSIKIATGSFKQ